jgi:hypothetical protein
MFRRPLRLRIPRRRLGVVLRQALRCTWFNKRAPVEPSYSLAMQVGDSGALVVQGAAASQVSLTQPSWAAGCILPRGGIRLFRPKQLTVLRRTFPPPQHARDICSDPRSDTTSSKASRVGKAHTQRHGHVWSFASRDSSSHRDDAELGPGPGNG